MNVVFWVYGYLGIIFIGEGSGVLIVRSCLCKVCLGCENCEE